MFSNAVWPILLQRVPAYAAYQPMVNQLLAANLNPVQYLLGGGAMVPLSWPARRGPRPSISMATAPSLR